MLKGNQALLFAGAAILALTAATKDPFQTKLKPDDRIVHALNRLTFGPRPGDLEKIKQLGLDAWIDLQLHPERIEQSLTLIAKLQPLSTLPLGNREILTSYPPPQLLRALAATGADGSRLGNTPEEKEMIQAVLKRYRARKTEGKKGASATDANANANTDPSDNPEAANAEKRLAEGDLDELRTLVTAAQFETLTKGRPRDKADLLESLPAGQLNAIVLALPRNLRQQAGAAASTPLRRKLLYAAQPTAVVTQDLTEGKLYRAVYSEKQLEEVLTDFWFNHFNVYLNKAFDRSLVTSYERDSIRPHVLGHFRDLLEATAKDPAMLVYLDNAQSVAPNAGNRPRNLPPGALSHLTPQQQQRLEQFRKRKRGLNENYARELMELHTLGVDGGYSQKDVTEVARCFTGWSVTPPRQPQDYGFRFNPRLHDDGEKIVLGVKIPANGGIKDGEKVLDILANHPSTAKHLSFQLAQRFVADQPPPELVNRMAATYLKSHGDLREVMRTMLQSPEFWSEGAYRAKIKSPLQLVASALRATGADIDFALPLSRELEQMGMPLYLKLEPTGYKNVGEEWVSSNALVGRMNFALNLTQNKIRGTKVTAELSDDPQEVAHQLMSAKLSEGTLKVIDQSITEKSDGRISKARLVAGLVLGSPEFQRN